MKPRARTKIKTYTNHLLVESVHTPKGPRQRIICSLGSLEPVPADHWLDLAHKLDAALRGQASLPGGATPVEGLATKARRGTRRTRGGGSTAAMAVDADRVAMEE